MRKYKKLYLLATIITCSIFFLIYEKKTANEYIFMCEGDVYYEVDENLKKTTLDAQYVLFLSKENNGFLQISGSVVNGGNKTDVDRTFFFDYKKNNKADIYEVLIKRGKTNNFDNTDSDLFYNNFFPEKPNERIYIKAQNLSEGFFLISGLSQPYFSCASTIAK